MPCATTSPLAGTGRRRPDELLERVGLTGAGEGHVAAARRRRAAAPLARPGPGGRAAGRVPRRADLRGRHQRPRHDPRDRARPRRRRLRRRAHHPRARRGRAAGRPGGDLRPRPRRRRRHAGRAARRGHDEIRFRSAPTLDTARSPRRSAWSVREVDAGEYVIAAAPDAAADGSADRLAGRPRPAAGRRARRARSAWRTCSAGSPPPAAQPQRRPAGGGDDAAPRVLLRPEPK